MRFCAAGGWLLGLVILLIVGGTAAMEWRKHQSEQAARASGDEIRAALAETDPAARAEALAPISEGASGAAVVARFARASSLAEAGDLETAGATLAGIAADPETSDLYRNLARLQRVMIMGDALPASERLAALETLTLAGSPFRAIGLEQRAMVRIETGETEAAVDDLRAVLDAPGASEEQRNRVQQFIIALGEEVIPEAPEVPETPAPDDGEGETDASGAGPADG